jgi:ATP-binding cassette subfamily B protein
LKAFPQKAVFPPTKGPVVSQAKAKLSSFFSQVWPYLHPHRGRFLLATVAVIVTSAIVLLLGQGLRHFVDKGLHAAAGVSMLPASLGLMALVIALAGASFLRAYGVSWLGEAFVLGLRADVVKNLLRQSPPFFENLSVGQTLSRLSNDLTLLQTVVGTVIPIAVRNGIMVVGGFVFLFITSVQLALIIVLMVPLIFGVLAVFGPRIRDQSRTVQQCHADCTDFVEESLHGLKTLQAYTQEVALYDRYQGLIQTLFAQAVKRNARRSVMTSLIILIVLVSVVGVLWIGALQVQRGSLSTGDLSAFLFYALVLAGSLNAFSDIGGELQKAAAAAERLFYLRDAPPALVDRPSPTPLPHPAAPVVFSDVVLAYPKFPDRPILQGISLTLNAGEHVALVGLSGSGKTSLFDLLLRFYAPQSGRITLAGVPIEDLAVHDLRRAVAYVPQDSFLMSASLQDNMTLSESCSVEILKKTADHVQLTPFIVSHKEGLAMPVGPRGLHLSGGQKQKINLSRAILKDADIVLLDEPTSSLDGLSEAHFLSILSTDWKDKTVLIAAHRLATVQTMDRILVIDQGRIVDSGRHADLYERCPLYRDLVDTQMIQGV